MLRALAMFCAAVGASATALPLGSLSPQHVQNLLRAWDLYEPFGEHFEKQQYVRLEQSFFPSYSSLVLYFCLLILTRASFHVLRMASR